MGYVIFSADVKSQQDEVESVCKFLLPMTVQQYRSMIQNDALTQTLLDKHLYGSKAKGNQTNKLVRESKKVFLMYKCVMYRAIRYQIS